MLVKRVFSLFLVIATLFAATILSGCNSKTENDDPDQVVNETENVDNGADSEDNSTADKASDDTVDDLEDDKTSEENGDTANKATDDKSDQEEDKKDSKENNDSVSINVKALSGNWVTVEAPGLFGHSEVTISEDDLKSFVVSSDENYVYLENQEVGGVLVLIDDDVLASCSTNLDDWVSEDDEGNLNYDVYIGTTPNGTKFYGGNCLLLVRPEAVQYQIPSNVDFDELAALIKDECFSTIENAEELECAYFPDFNMLCVSVSGVMPCDIYVSENGDLIPVRCLGLNHLNGYEEEAIFTDNNTVIIPY